MNSVTRARFQMIGVEYDESNPGRRKNDAEDCGSYQPGAQSGYDPESKKDPLSDGDVCLRDAALMQRLGVGTPSLASVRLC